MRTQIAILGLLLVLGGITETFAGIYLTQSIWAFISAILLILAGAVLHSLLQELEKSK